MKSAVNHQGAIIVIQNGVGQGAADLFGCAREIGVPGKRHDFVHRESSVCERQVYSGLADRVHHVTTLWRGDTGVITEVIERVYP